MSSDEENLFDRKSLNSSSKSSHSDSPPQKMQFKRLNRGAVDSDEELFDKIDGAANISHKKPEKKQFAKKLMKMFYDGDDQDRPKPKKKQQKLAAQSKQTETKHLKRLSKRMSDDESPKETGKQPTENHQGEQQIEQKNGRVQQIASRKKKLKRKRSISSGNSQSSVNDSASLVPSSQPEDSEQYSYSGPRRHKESKRERLRLKNQQKLKEWQQKYSVEQKDDDVPPVSEGQAYYTGMQFNYNFTTKRDKNAVKSRNKLFGEFQLTSQENEDTSVVEPTKQQVEQLDIKVKQIPVKSITQFRFVNKLNAIRKARGLDKPEIAATTEGIGSEVSITLDDSNLRASQSRKAKESLMKMVTCPTIRHEQNVQYELSVGIPYLARGKSSEVLNNTIYLKKLSSVQNSTKADQQQSSLHEDPTIINPQPTQTKVRASKLTRKDFLSSMINDIKLRRSKFLSLEDIKESFKKTDLDELELAKQRIDKKKNQMMDDIMGQDKEDEDYQPSEEGSEEQLELVVQDKEKQHGQDNQTNKQGDKNQSYLDEQEYKKLMAREVDEDQLEIQEQPQEESHEESKDQIEQVPQQIQQTEQLPQPEGVPIQEEAESQVKSIKPTELNADIKEQIDEENSYIQAPIDIIEQQEEQDADDIRAESESEEQSQDEEQASVDKDFIASENESAEPDAEADVHAGAERSAMIQEKSVQEADITPGRQMLQDNRQSMGMFKKLKNLAQKVLEKKQKKEKALKMVNEFMDEQAELGSDNESNDDRRKDINYAEEEREYEGEDLDADLEQLIDNAPYLMNDEDEEQAYQKFLKDQRMQEKQELMRVIKGEFRKSKKEYMDDMVSDDDEKHRDQRMQEMIQRYKQQDEYDDGMFYKGNADGIEDRDSAQSVGEEDMDEQEKKDYVEFFKVGMNKRQSYVSYKSSNPQQMSIFSEPKSNSISSNSVLMGLKNRSSLLSVASDKSRICSFEQVKFQNNGMKSSLKSNLNKLYQKNVMTSKTTFMLGLKRTNSLKVDQ